MRTPIIEALDEISDRYDALLCDVWGCYHDGVAPYRAAVSALRAFRARGGTVLLLTNAPRPAEAVRQHLLGMGAPQDSWDAIVTSGDAARNEVASGRMGRRVEHVGPDRDLGFFDGLDVRRVGREQADSVVLTGLFDDETETAADYAPSIADWLARRLPMLCCNPDVVVHRGDRLLYCAGAIAQAYEKAGGTVVQAGKPHAPIYRLAMEVLATRTADATPRVLAVGDGVATDIAGANAAGLDALFVTGGLAAAELSDDPEIPDSSRLDAYLERNGAHAAYAIGRLR
jgi:HAD superfamily hydrolase (TIGR01459 family)